MLHKGFNAIFIPYQSWNRYSKLRSIFRSAFEMIESLRRKFQTSKFRLMMAIGLIAIASLIFLWLTSTNPYLLENPTWLFSKPSDDTIIESLSSAKNVNYRPLRSLLQAKQWEDADKETQRSLAKTLSPIRSNLLILRAKEIQKIPCTDLLTVDLLWIKFSYGRFGFSVQKRIVENDNKLSSPAEIKKACLRKCPQEISRSIMGIRSIDGIRCKRGCESQRIEAEFVRIPEKMGRGESAVGTQLPAGYYPSPIEVIRDHKADAYHELAKRANRCHV
jgi:GUN4-like